MRRLLNSRNGRRKNGVQDATVPDPSAPPPPEPEPEPEPESEPVNFDDAFATETTPMIPKSISHDPDHVLNTDIVDDGQYDETYGRQIANWLMDFHLYNPRKDADPIPIRSSATAADLESDKPRKTHVQPPSLQKAWDFFEYQCLPRRFTYIEDAGVGRKYVLASKGEKEPTKLYPVFDTPIGDMADFGIGVGMYFQSVRYFGIVCFLAGCISIPSMRYYASETYSPGMESDTVNEFITDVSGVCTDQKFQPCPSCPKPGEADYEPERMITHGDMTMILTNRCELSSVFGYYAFASLMFVTLAVYLFVYMQRRYRIELDESEQTSSDYSIRIMNPPTSETAKDPETWKKFFEEKFENMQVKACTVAINNEELLEALAEKYTLRVQLIDKLPVDVEYDEADLDAMAEHSIPPKHVTRMQYIVFYVLVFLICFFIFEFAITHSAIFAVLALVLIQRVSGKTVTGHEIVEKMRECDAKIHEISAEESDDFKVSDVFVTFETEEMQRLVLTSLSVPGFRRSEIHEEFKFEDVVLQVEEPDEPSSMRWEDLDVPFWIEQRRKALSNVLVVLFTVFGGFAIAYARTHGAVTSTLLIILLNAFSPVIADTLTESESHDTQTSFTASAYVKITLIRWVFTVLVNFLTSPFTEIIQPKALIEEVRLLYTAESIQKPILQMFDIGGHIARHFKGPRAKDQRNMNLTFMAGTYSIGEKYTEITKLLFFTFFYAIIFPMGFFYASGIFLVYYWTDKFSILRQWRQGPKINAEVSMMSTYYLWLTLLFYAIAAAYTVAEFPFDNACLAETALPESYIGQSFKIHHGEMAGTTITVGADAPVYEFCEQNLLKGVGFFTSFPPLPGRLEDASSWMSPQQLQLATFFGWALTGVFILVVCSIATRLFLEYVKPLFDEKWTPDGEASDMRFSDVAEIYGYIPNIEKSNLQFPLLLCDVSEIDPELISWSCNFEDYSLIYDVPEIYRKKSFSSVKCWDTSTVLPPPEAKHENEPIKITLTGIASYYSGLKEY